MLRCFKVCFKNSVKHNFQLQAEDNFLYSFFSDYATGKGKQRMLSLCHARIMEKATDLGQITPVSVLRSLHLIKS